jgi:transketolase
MDLKKRIIDISYKKGLSHLGSCLSAVNIIDEIYAVKKEKDTFVLSAGHAAMALYVVLEKYLGHDAEMLYDLHGTHPNRDIEHGLECSTGSLGQGLPIALGMAMANKNKNVFCLLSDGECSEGSIWEALRVGWEYKVSNLIVLVNVNGWGAYKKIKGEDLHAQLVGFMGDVLVETGMGRGKLPKLLKQRRRFPTVIFCRTTVEQHPALKGNEAHYKILNKDDYELKE